MRVLGVDPGSVHMGLACIQLEGRQLVCVGHHLVRVKEKADSTLEDRLRKIYFSTKECIQAWKPEVASVENVFTAKNSLSALRLGQARGSALTAIAIHGIPIYEYTARSVKQRVTSTGSASKEQVERMVRLLLGSSFLEKDLRHDVFDALAISICHIQSCSKIHTNSKKAFKMKQSRRKGQAL